MDFHRFFVFMTAFEWVRTEQANEPSGDVYCPTRDVAQGRVQKLPKILQAEHWPEGVAYVFAAIMGELSNNSFDHNNMWRDVSGCWFEVVSEGKTLRGIVADRGQGVLSSLRQAHPEISDEVEALVRVFRGGITGRAPERRGNGLRYVWDEMNKRLPESHLRYASGPAELDFSAPRGQDALNQCVRKVSESVGGVYAELVLRR